MIYIVRPGDTISSLAPTLNVSPDRLRYDNQISLTDTLVVGQALIALPAAVTHRVQPGETAFSIAGQYGITLRELLQRNPFLAQGAYSLSPSADNPEAGTGPAPSAFSGIIPLTPGQYLVIEYAGQSAKPTALEGYAYPFIQRNILREALPCLRSLFIFSYGFTPTGQLVAPPNARFLIDEAKLFGINPILVLTPSSDAGAFNSNLVSVLVNSAEVQETLISQLLTTADQMGYTGIDIDFEFISARDRDGYTSFIAALAARAHPAGLTVSVALPPKTSAAQKGLLYEGVDYGGLGSVADQVLLMTYEWGYTYGPPMAVAPIPNVRRVVEYALTEIPASKIFLGIPNYGYDWPLPFVRGTTAAAIIGNAQAIAIARSYGSEIQFDETALAPWFRYRTGGTEHVVWFEDVRSINAKFELITEYALAGGGYWNLMREFRANWVMAGASFALETGGPPQ